MLRYGKSTLNTIPALRLLLPLILGILLQYHFNISIFPFVVLAIIGVFFLIIYIYKRQQKNFHGVC